jgi:hypothetical protein
MVAPERLSSEPYAYVIQVQYPASGLLVLAKGVHVTGMNALRVSEHHIYRSAARA